MRRVWTCQNIKSTGHCLVGISHNLFYRYISAIPWHLWYSCTWSSTASGAGWVTPYQSDPTGFPGLAFPRLELCLSLLHLPRWAAPMPQCRHCLHHLAHFQIVLWWLQCSLQKYALPKKMLGYHGVPDRPKLLVELHAPFFLIRTIEWFGLEGISRLSSSNPAATGRGTFH